MSTSNRQDVVERIAQLVACPSLSQILRKEKASYSYIPFAYMHYTFPEHPASTSHFQLPFLLHTIIATSHLHLAEPPIVTTPHIHSTLHSFTSRFHQRVLQSKPSSTHSGPVDNRNQNSCSSSPCPSHTIFTIVKPIRVWIWWLWDKGKWWQLNPPSAPSMMITIRDMDERKTPASVAVAPTKAQIPSQILYSSGRMPRRNMPTWKGFVNTHDAHAIPNVLRQISLDVPITVQLSFVCFGATYSICNLDYNARNE